MMSDMSSDDFEMIESEDIIKQMLVDEKPDLEKIRKWLNPTDYLASSSEFNRHASSKALNTGEWIRETSQFDQWHSSADHGSIWIKAVPGAGKSVLAASMVQSLSANESAPVLFFFFRQIIETNRTSRGLLRDWMCQLLPFSEALQLNLFEHVKNEQSLESITTAHLWKHLLTGLRMLKRVYCIADALDEMNMDEEFLSQLNALGSFRPGQVKVLLTSRPKQYLQRAFKDPQVIHVSLEEELVKRDISIFVRQRVEQFAEDGINETMQSFIQSTVCERSEGLFLYARLMLDQVAQSIKNKEHSDVSIQGMIAKLPVGLEEMYNRVLIDHASLTKIHRDIQIIILQLITQSARPMRLIEIAKAIQDNPHLAKSDRDAKEIVRSGCGPLLEVMEDGVVQILHHSFTEFLLDTNRTTHKLLKIPQFPVIDSKNAHREIVLLCIGQLQGGAFSSYPISDNAEDGGGNGKQSRRQQFDFGQSFIQYPFVEYAAKKWTYHAKRYDYEDESLYEKLEDFCQPDNQAFKAWSMLAGQTMKSIASSEFRRQFDPALASEVTSHLHVASGFGLGCWVQRLLENGADFEMRDSTERTPLFWAAKGGHTEVVKKLLDAGAEPDVDGYDGLKPLHVAASNNHAGVVKLLLGAGVSPLTLRTKHLGRRCGKPLSKLGQHPLMLASSAGHVETILEMISYCETKELEAALLRAAHHGHHALVSTILEKTDVSPNAQVLAEYADMEILRGQTVLMVATSSLEPKSVKSLIEKGGIPSLGSATRTNVGSSSFITGRRNTVGLAGRTPLHSLAMTAMEQEDRHAAKEILDLLLLAGADLEARDNNGDTPLLLTVSPKSHRYSQIALELLLSAGADPCTMDSDGETLLHRTCTELSSTDLAKQLLAFGVNPNQARISDGVTPLHCVVDNRHKPAELIEVLVKHGANINAQDINGDTTLHHACRSNSIKSGNLIPTILSSEPDVNIQNNLDETCLHNIYSDADPELIGAIIDTDMNIELYDRKGMTVLLRAVARYPYANIKVIEALLKHPKKASISARTWLQGKSVLHLACHSRNSVELIKTLLSHGADLNWTDSMNGNTLLHEVAARFDGDLEDTALIKYLCESGVSVNAKNYRQQTAVHIRGPAYGNGKKFLTMDLKQTFISVVRRLCPELDVNVKDMEGYTPLHYACAASEPSVFDLIMAGADLNAKSFNRRTLLHCAALGRQCGILSMILNYAQKTGSTIDVNAQDIDGMTPLHFACVSGRPESVSILISAGADIDKKIKRATSEATPLMACAMFPEEDQIWKMLQKGNSPDLSLRDSFRVPPIPFDKIGFVFTSDEETQHITCRVGIIAKMLIKAGADTANSIISARDAKCADLVYAIRGEHFTKSKNFAESQLMASIISTEKALDDCTHEDIDCMKSKVCDLNETTMECMVARGFDFTRADNVGLMRDLGPPIAQFAHYGLTEFMEKIISSAKLFDDSQYTGPIADSFSDGWSVIRPLLHVACDRPIWNMDMVKLLVEVGQVDINAHRATKEKNNAVQTESIVKGKTALHVLAQGDFWWQVEAIRYLGEHGAEIDILDEKGRTPLEIASTYTENGSVIRRHFFRAKCCEALLELGANPNKINPEGLTALNKAGSDADTIKILLKHGANVNGGMKSVLASAIECGDVETLRLYLQNGADPNVPDNSTDSSYRAHEVANVAKKYPIVAAALPKGYKAHSASIAAEMIQVLLDHGARVDVAVDEGETILHYIFANATSSALSPFFERPGIDMNIRDQSGRTVLLSALANSTQKEGRYPHVPPSKLDQPQPPYVRPYVHLVKSATHGPSLNYLAVDNEGRHIIFYLISRWTSETASLFLSIPGVRSLITQKDNTGYSPLHRVLSSPFMSPLSNEIFIVNILLNEGGADLLEPDPESNTVLHYISRKYPFTNMADYFPLMNRFISLGGSINARNNAGMTPLLLYLDAGGNSTHLPWYEEHGADFKAKNNEGEGVLHIVAKQEHPMRTPSSFSGEDEEGTPKRHWFEVLVKQYGCEVLDEDSKGRTALDIAAAVGNEEILKLFQRRK